MFKTKYKFYKTILTLSTGDFSMHVLSIIINISCLKIFFAIVYNWAIILYFN